ncbi:hypothetical protein CH333_10110 [candidate division WOR-3 bacterium JGI_Cruoil_03_44_89]|uniref:Xanthine dehydrogenase n=1 Tax=candidate division WOR-3 bacterium JGI_Cruoil_03_44_89 TaxID=1973748 RepID=A0A235BMR7_UNCW3|nr:MAG: hypothetical protein CH333_10110 [candidate division WOR-3 bacterium JGI_Cruoil_03_44_89]
MKKLYREIIDLCNRGKAIALATVVESVGSSPGKAGAKMIVEEDGTTIGTVGGGQVEFAVIKEGIEAIRTKTPKLIEYELKDDMLCGGKMKIFVEPILTDPVLYIFGAGHIGRALSKIAATAGFNITVIDDREQFPTRERFPDAKELISGNYEKIIPDLPLDHNSYIVITTRAHSTDEAVLRECIGREHAYIGMVASREKTNGIFSRLKEQGISEKQLREVHAPIGKKIGSRTPGEIAVSIMAEIISVKNS